MAGQVRIEFDVQSQKGLQEFDKLNKKQQRTIVLGSKIGKEFDKTGKKIKKSGKTGSAAFSNVASGIVSSLGAMQLFSKALAVGNRELEVMKKRSADVFERQKTVKDIIGKFVSDTGASPDQIKNVTSFSQKESIKTGVRQEEIIAGVTTAISKVGTSFTEKQIFNAVSKATEQKVVNVDLDVGEITQAILRLQKQGFTLKQASNFTAGFGPQFGGKFSDILPNVGGLIQQAAGTREFEKGRFGKGVTEQEDVFALTGFISQKLGEDAATTTTLVKNLFSRINLAQKGDKAFDFKTEGALNRIIELSKAFRKGEIKDKDLIKFFTSAGLKGSKAISTLTAISTGEEDLKGRKKALGGFLKGDRDVSAEQLKTFKSVEQVANIIKGQQEKRKTEISQFSNTEAARKKRVVEDIQEQRKVTGVGEGIVFKIEELLFEFGSLSEGRLKETALREGLTIPSQLKGLFVDEEAKAARKEQAVLLGRLVELMEKGFTREKAFETIENDKLITPPGNGQEVE